MKKLLFIVVAVIAMSFASCGNKVTPTSNVKDTIAQVDSDSAVADSVAADSVCAD